MSKEQKGKKVRGRKDHWLPQGYLRGFIGPSRTSVPKPLFCFYKHTQKWAEVSTAEVAFGKGFYDYARGTDHAATTDPDSVFARLEREYPQRRDEMAARRFENWEQHKDFLLDFMQMMRARSPLAMQQQEVGARKVRATTITSVSPDRRSVTVDSLELRPLHDQGVRNFTISRMLQDAQAGASWMSKFDWCLRYTESENDPFCTTDQAIIVIGTVKGLPMGHELLSHPDTVIIFPLCWQACLFGSALKFDKSYDRAHPTQLVSLRSDQKRLTNRFVVSPVIL